VGGGSNALGAFYAFLDDTQVKLTGVEAGGKGKGYGQHAARFPGAEVGILEGYKSYFLQDKDGNTAPTTSVAAGLDYVGIGPELAELKDSGRVQFERCSDKEALDAAKALAQTEGIIPALESAHAVAYGVKLAAKLPKAKTVVINMSGRGDKDMFTLAKHFSKQEFKKFLERELESYGGDDE
jgi:tryptophan synthase beta chain